MQIRSTASVYRRADRLTIVLVGLALALGGCGGGGGGSSDSDQDTTSVTGGSNLTLAELGERIFFDENLSEPPGQSCGSCHEPTAAFADPGSVDKTSPVSIGADGVSSGTRNAPTASYAAFIPPFATAPPRGGQFVDGRAASLEEQARAPFLNPVEMNMADESAVVARLSAADYADDFRAIFGDDALNDVTTAYTQMVTAIAAFERTDAFSPFSSKFDQDPTSFTDDELAGQALFNGKAQCNLCHDSGAGNRQVFSDFRYSNLGVPANPALVGACTHRSGSHGGHCI